METQTKWYNKTASECLERLQTGMQGLSEQEAQKRLNTHGPNKIPEAKPDSLVKLFFRQFQSPLIYLLFVAAVIVVIIGELADGGIIIAVLMINAIIGSVQEGRASKTLAALQTFVKTNATVIREGIETIVSDEQLVPGDIIVLREGEKVPADCRILEQSSLRVIEASLTGESEPVDKNAETIPATITLPPNDQRNMLFRGTLIALGNAEAVVVATGQATVIGTISGQIAHIHHEIPLQKHIRELSHMLIWIVLGCSIGLFGIGVLRGLPTKEIFATVVSLAVSIIPEGLPIAVTLILASGVWRMSKRNALVKKLQAVEALGHVDVVAVDKTGTITKNQLVVTEIIIKNKHYTLTGSGYEPTGSISVGTNLIIPAEDPDLMRVGQIFALVGNARVLHDTKTDSWNIAGDPTDAALVVAAAKMGLVRDELASRYPLVEEVPFDYRKKFHATMHKIGETYFVSAIGAPEAILELCEKTDETLVKNQTRHAAARGLRVLAFAYSDNAKFLASAAMPKLQFGGLVTMLDQLEETVPEAVQELHNTGIRVVMITGDNPITAIAIAKAASISSGDEEPITGNDLQILSQEALSKRLVSASVFARVTPQDKMTLITGYRKLGLTVAMTGDGVNDAPALVAADLGLAMGKTGTEVAKEAADIILLDDNFTTINAAVEEGRNIYQTIRKVLLYLFSTSLGELLTISIAIIAGLSTPLLAVQILWLNFVTDGFLTVALGMDPKEDGLLGKHFNKPSRYILEFTDIHRMVLMGIVMAVASIWLFITHPGELVYRQTLVLTLLAVVQWLNAWNCRTSSSIFTNPPWQSKWLMGSLMVVIILQLCAVYVPSFQDILKTVPITGQDWLMVTGLALLVIVVDELWKLARKNKPG